MKNKCMYVLIILIIFTGIIFSGTKVNAQEVAIESSIKMADDKLTDPSKNPSSYKPSDMTNADKIKNKGNKIIGAVQFVGSFVSVIALVIMGIKYMLGSVEEKAEYKKTMMPYVIGAILLFATSNLLGIVDSVSKGIFN